MSEAERKTFLFTLRVWSEPQEDNLVEWRGRLQALPDGEACFFRGWSGLIEGLESIVGSEGFADDHSTTKKSGG